MMPTCRSCLFWKRRTARRGWCWHHAAETHGTTTAESSTCDRHEPSLVASLADDMAALVAWHDAEFFRLLARFVETRA